jgi:tetratricopeptide (TPR) repeat protein
MAPLSPVIHYNLAAVYFEKRELDQALSAVKVALHLEPQYIAARLLLGRILEAKGLYEESLRELKWVVEQDPMGRIGRDARDALVNLAGKAGR